MYDTLEQQATESFVNIDAQQVAAPQLSSGERILWAGKPRQGMFMQPQDAAVIPFSVAWCGFACFWTFMAWRGGAPWPMLMFGSLFVGIGLFMVFGRFIADAKNRAVTFYALTDQRILFIKGLAGTNQTVTSIDLKTMGDITMVQAKEGRGSVMFNATGLPSIPAARAAMMINRASSSPTMFVQISRVKDVYDLIRKTKDAALEKSRA
ncbi:MAG: hypothetical protein WAU88_12570 [Candidatus Zixiibacteriota bacterium]